MVSLLLSCWSNWQTNEHYFRLVRTDTAEEIVVADSVFLLRTTIDEQGQVIRLQLRNVQSGREVYIQSSTAAQAFFRDCILSAHQDSKPSDITDTSS